MKKILTAFSMMLCTLQMSAGDIYVSVNGNDAADGTRQRPLATLRQALCQAREWRRLGSEQTQGGVHIILGGGTYQMTEGVFVRPEDSGTEVSPTIIESAKGETASLSGGPDGLKARRYKYMLPYGTMQRLIDFNIKDESITIPTPKDHSFIDDLCGLEMVVHQRWAIAILRVREMQVHGDKTVVKFMQPESRLEFAHPWPQPIIDGERGSSSFCLRRLVDSSFMMERLVTVLGTESQPVSNITFRNIKFENTSWLRPSQMGHVTLQGGFPVIDAYKLQKEGLPWSKTLENQAWIERPQSAVSIKWARGVNFDGCSFAHLSATALDYVLGTKDCNITRNTFSDIGGTAILVGSFAEGATEVHRPLKQTDEEFCERMTISDNHITDVANEDWGCVGIGAGVVRHVSIQRNDVSQVNYSGICVGWGWTPLDQGMCNNRIEDNNVHDFARQLYDAGGIYTLSNQPNSVIKNNKISAPTDAPYATNHRAFCIYFDEATDGFTVEGNIMPKEKLGWNKPGPAMKVLDK